MKKENSSKIIIGASIALLLSGGLVFYNYNQQEKINAEVQNRQEILDKKEKELSTLPKTVTKKLLKNNDTETAKRLELNAQASQRVKAFFTELYHVDSHMTQEQWDQRYDNLKQYAGTKVISYTGFDYKSQGINRSTDTQIQVKSVNVSTGGIDDAGLDGLVRIRYTIDSNIQDNPKERIDVYQWVVDPSSKQIVALLSLGQERSKEI